VVPAPRRLPYWSANFSCNYYSVQPTVHRNGALVGSNLNSTPLSLDSLDVAVLSTLAPLQLASLAARLAALQSSVASAMFQIAVAAPHNGNAAGPTRMIDADEACTILKCPRRWLFDHAKRYAWIKRLSRKVILVDESAMMRWIASRTR
jgi:hypothetical protein